MSWPTNKDRAVYVREIGGVLLFKIAIILLAGFTIFGAGARLHVDDNKMLQHLFSNEGSRP